ncbi:MAG: alpha/beta hydrolase [Rubrivivax sp.]
MLVTRGHAQLHVQAFGQGPVTLLALGGWTAPGLVWHDLFSHLPHWRCVSLDHRGTGLTLSETASIDVDTMADDLLAVVEALRPARCVLAAESSGAAPALRAALKAPGRFDSLVLAGAAWKPMPQAAFDATSARLRADHDGFVRAFAEACLPEAPALHRWGHALLRASSPDAAVALMRCRVGLEWGDELRRLALPALLLHGSRDAIVPPAHSRELAALLPRATVVELPGLGHAPMITAPAELARRIEQQVCALELCRG